MHKHGEPWEPGSMKVRYFTGSFEAIYKKSINLFIANEIATKRSLTLFQEKLIFSLKIYFYLLNQDNMSHVSLIHSIMTMLKKYH